MTKQEIIIKGHELFFSNGYRDTTVNEIALHLKISKKTFYKYFKSKEDFIIEVTKYRVEYFKNLAKFCNDRCSDVIEYYLDFLRESDKISGFVSGRENIDDLYTYYKKVVPDYEQLMDEIFKDFFQSVVKRGIEEKLIDEHVDLDIYRTIYANQYLYTRSTQSYAHHKLKDVLNQTYYLFLKGILNKHGIQLLESKNDSLMVSDWLSVN